MSNKKDLTILWLDDKREANKYFAKPSTSGAFKRNADFYNNNIFNQYNPHFVWVRNIREFKQYILQNGMPEFISFDHDLTVDKNSPEPDGREVAKWLMQYCKETGEQRPKCFVHSANQSKTPEMNQILGINESKKNINMKKQTIKLNESQLQRVIKESVKNVLNEMNYDPRVGKILKATAGDNKFNQFLAGFKSVFKDDSAFVQWDENEAFSIESLKQLFYKGYISIGDNLEIEYIPERNSYRWEIYYGENEIKVNGEPTPYNLGVTAGRIYNNYSDCI